ncbi:MAG: cobalt-precorrin-5B (C(1))-methyltransferase CbiD [Angelakisella sp.]
MAFEHYIEHGTKRLRCGYTTGSCAALAAKAAVQMLLTGMKTEAVTIRTPKGLPVTASVLNIAMQSDAVRCAVCKDAGDDCDVTDGALVFATVTKVEKPGVSIDGGMGIGRVTKPGLDQPVGAAAINSTPRRMIAEAVAEVGVTYGYSGGFSVLIEMPDGERLAQKTFNPNLGIVGGVSILGTSGIVEPQSLQALIDSIGVEVRMLAAGGAKQLIITPGNYGEAFLQQYPELVILPQVKCANFIGDTLDFAAANGFQELLLVGHIGKTVKLAGGIMNTHSRYADCRTELFALHAALCGATPPVLRELLSAATSDGCIEILRREQICEATLESISEAAQQYLERRAAGAFAVGLITFSNLYGLLTKSKQAEQILQNWEQSL